MEKKPAQKGLEAGGLAIGRGLTPARPPASPVPPPPHQVPFGFAEQAIETLQAAGLGVGTHHLHHLLMQGLAAPRPPAPLQPVVQFPHRIPQPGELQGAELGGWRLGLQPG